MNDDDGLEAESTWIAVDLERISKLPDVLRRLWPPELVPEPTRTAATTGESAPPISKAPSTPMAVRFVPPIPPRRRHLDILSAWLRGFAGELDACRSRLVIVISSGAETVHVVISVHEATALAILVLGGAEYSNISGIQFLKRMSIDNVAPAVDELSDLISADCALTLTYAIAGDTTTATGIDFLLRTDGTWTQPNLERSEGGVRVTHQHPTSANAVRTLLASVLSRICHRESAAGRSS